MEAEGGAPSANSAPFLALPITRRCVRMGQATRPMGEVSGNLPRAWGGVGCIPKHRRTQLELCGWLYLVFFIFCNAVFIY